MPTPLRSMSSIRNPTDGLGAPWYCSSSPMPRIWKKRGREVPPDQFRFGTRPSTSAKCWRPAASSVVAGSTVMLAGISSSVCRRNEAVTTTSSSSAPAASRGGTSASAAGDRQASAAIEVSRARREARSRSRPWHDDGRRDNCGWQRPAPYAGINRIRFNGFVAEQGLPAGDISGPFRPPQGRRKYTVQALPTDPKLLTGGTHWGLMRISVPSGTATE